MDELQRLRDQNLALDRQVRDLVKTEESMFRAQAALARQLDRVARLSDFLLHRRNDDLASLAESVVDLLQDLFLIDEAFAVVAHEGGYQWVGSALPLPVEDFVALAGDRPRIGTLAGPLQQATQLLEEAATQLSLPLRDQEGELQALIVGIGRTGRISVVRERLEPSHQAFLSLVAGHAEQLLATTMLTRRLQVRSEELVASNAQLQRSLEELESAQAQLVQTSKLEALGRLAGGVAHDFNNLLTVMMSYAEELVESPEDPNRVQWQARQIVRSVERAAGLTRQLLMFGQRGQGGAPEPLDLNRAIMETSELLGRIIGEDIELRIGLDTRPMLVRIDPSQLQQLLLNLVVNGRDAMDGTGELVIETRRMSEPSPQVVLVVRDEGRGMSPADQAKMFEPFYTTKASGTGMGLAVVYGVVQQSGGQIAVQSELGKGTTIRVSWPLSEQHAHGTPQPPTRASRGYRLLVVDDEDSIRDVARMVLERAGYEVVTAVDGVDALRVLEAAGPVDLVVTDVVMPRLGGIGLSHEVATRYPDTLVRFMSGYTGNAANEIARPHLLSKPFRPRDLLRLVEQALQQLSTRAG